MTSALRLDREDRWRPTPPSDTAAVRYQEWQHFVVFGPGVELLVNFNLHDAPTGGAGGARVIVIARADGCAGFVEEVPRGQCEVSRGGRAARFGDHTMTLRPEGYEVTLHAPARGVEARLSLTPRALPMIARNAEIAPGRRLDWLVVPRLEARGQVSLGGRVHRLDGAVAYHDHNWGRLAWGDDYVWDWGVALARSDAAPWAFLYSAGFNRARTRLFYEYAIAWDGPATALSASGPDARATWRGRLARPASLRLPGPLALARGRRDRDLPASVEVAAHNGDDVLTARFDLAETAEVLIPSDRDPTGALTLHECFGPATIGGAVGGHAVREEGVGVFEFVRA
jgi:hypothetical protein